MAKADVDLRVAEHALEMEGEAPADPICFHAQQCVEKYVQAALLWRGIEPPWIHDLAVLVDLLPDPGAACLTPEEQERLTDYAMITRYPGDYDPLTPAHAKAVVAIARRARQALRRLLPRECLRE